jgi:hypothetical protein
MSPSQFGLTALTSAAMVLGPLDASAAVQVFEGDAGAWSAAVTGGTVTTLSFDTIAGSTRSPIAGTEFSAFAAGPVFTSVIGDGVYVGNPAPGQIPRPPSGANMLSPSSCSFSCEGVVRVSFAAPVFAIGGVFVDVENEFALTGYSLQLGAVVPSVKFSSAPGDRSFKFLGLVSDVAFSAVDIHFTTGPSIDGALLDNLVYAQAAVPAVPEPSSHALLSGGLLLVGLKAFRTRRSRG